MDYEKILQQPMHILQTSRYLPQLISKEFFQWLRETLNQQHEQKETSHLI